MIDMTTGKKSCVPAHRSHFHGNGNCDVTRDANKRADQRSDWQTGMESEIAPYNGVRNTAMQNGGMGGQMTQGGGMTGEMLENDAMAAQMMPYGGTSGHMALSRGVGAQAAQGGGAESDEIFDGYGVEHDHPASEEDGMSSFPQDSFTEPLNADEAARNSWRALLARNVGRNVLVRFLIGTQNMVTVEGELYEVGTDYIVIYQPLWDSHITADLYSVKFVEFREPPGVMTLA